MYRVLMNLPSLSSGVQQIPQRDYLIRELKNNLNEVQKRYQRFTYTVPSTHLLYLLLAQLPIRFDTSVQRYYDSIVDITSSSASRVGLTTDAFAGKLHDGAFYPNCQEMVIAHGQSRLLTQSAIGNWRFWSPVRIHSHPFSSLRYHPLHAKSVETGGGIACIGIDVPLLAVQYRLWALAMGYVEDGKIRIKEPIQSFLASFPLVNALWSHNDVVLRNRCLVGDITRITYHGEISLPKLDSTIAQVSATVQERLAKQARSYTDILKQVPSLEGDQFDATREEWHVALRQTRWAYDLGCLDLWLQLTGIAKRFKDEGKDFNSQVNGDLYRACERSINEGNWNSAPLGSGFRTSVVTDVRQVMANIT